MSLVMDSHLRALEAVVSEARYFHSDCEPEECTLRKALDQMDETLGETYPRKVRG